MIAYSPMRRWDKYCFRSSITWVRYVAIHRHSSCLSEGRFWCNSLIPWHRRLRCWDAFASFKYCDISSCPHTLHDANEANFSNPSIFLTFFMFKFLVCQLAASSCSVRFRLPALSSFSRYIKNSRCCHGLAWIGNNHSFANHILQNAATFSETAV